MKNSQGKSEWISIPMLEPPYNIEDFEYSDEPAWSDPEELAMKTYFVLKDPYGNCWCKNTRNGASKYFLNGGNAYYHPDTCLRFKTLEEAELEAMNIINQETYVNIPGNVNKVFIEIMVVDEEKEQEYADSIFVDTMFNKSYNKAKEEAHKDYEEMKNEKLKKQAKIIKWFRGH